MPVAERVVVLPSTVEAIMAVLTDFPAYPRIFPILESAEVKRSAGVEWEVCFTLFFLRRLRYTLLIRRPEPSLLSWSLVEGDLKAAEGSWALSALADGSTSACFRVDVQPGIRLPGPFLRSLEEEELPRVLRGLEAELSARQAALDAASALPVRIDEPVGVDGPARVDEGAASS